MTATPEVDLPHDGTASTIRNPATGAVAGQVRWSDPRMYRDRRGLRKRRRIGSARRQGPCQSACRYAVWLGEHRDEIEAL